MAATFAELGFVVITGLDLDKAAMDRKIREFADSLAGAEAGVFFYAGHGLQVAGNNYLVPIDASLTTAAALDFEMVRLDLVHRTMEREALTNIIFLDACRDNPLARNLSRSFGTRSADIGQGLAKIESGAGTLISFSTQPGNVALDGKGRNSPFTAALARRIRSSTSDLSGLLIDVRNDVMAATERKQVPWDNSALTARFYFKTPAIASATTVPNRPANATSATNPAPTTAREFQDCPDCPRMVVVPAGEFMMGTSEDEVAEAKTKPGTYWWAFYQQSPKSRVRIQRPFALSRTHVTAGEFAAFVNATGYEPKKGCRNIGKSWALTDAAASWQAPGFPQNSRHPVVCVSWDDANAYAKWLADTTGKAYRLPSEAEAEYSVLGTASGRSNMRYFFGDDERQLCAHANILDETTATAIPQWANMGAPCNDGFKYTAPAGSFKANSLGLHDIMGNAQIWTADCWNESHSGNLNDGSARGTGDCAQRVVKSSSWNFSGIARPAMRITYPVGDRLDLVGFRVAMTLPTP